MSFGLGTISSEVKMAIGKNFIGIWKKHFSLISTSVYSLVLVVLEKIMESVFKCPEKLLWRRLYSSFYFIMPFLAMLFLGIIFQTTCLHPSYGAKKCCYFDQTLKCCVCCTEKQERSRCCGIFLKAFLPALLWIVILLLDGRYADCFWENVTGENPHQSIGVYQISQMVGIGVILLVVLAGFIYWCYVHFFKKDNRKEINRDQVESRNLLEEKTCEYILKQKKEAIWQLLKKCLNDEHLADPETILVSIKKETIFGIIDRVCNISREDSGDQGGMASTSPQGTSSPSPQVIPENLSCSRV
ncbi:hypothetical protein KIL84_009716 [Mauremys mutica]|uniref:Uncharacterized protein n=1 Tax=Mauremys mutica TaxID=74926 RepID=A0A9D4AZ59_9SAUR|nr:hypothetical protein KIL84_009716 [Mauremys mutica]